MMTRIFGQIDYHMGKIHNTVHTHITYKHIMYLKSRGFPYRFDLMTYFAVFALSPLDMPDMLHIVLQIVCALIFSRL